MRRFVGLLSVAALLTVGMAACGGGGGDTTGDGSNAGGGATDLTVNTLDSFSFDPADTTVPAGAEVNLTLDNTDQALEHSWVVLNAGLTTDDALLIAHDGDEDKKFYEARVGVGETSSSTFTAPEEPGTYVVVCAVAGHAAGGMLGTLTVQ